MKKLRKLGCAVLMLMATIAGDVVHAQDMQLLPGEVYTNDYATWASKEDAQQGIAQINIEVYGKNKQQASDVAYVVDVSDSMLYKSDSELANYQITAWKQMRDASRMFFEQMLTGEGNEENQIALIPFARSVYDEDYTKEVTNFWNRHEWLYCNEKSQSIKETKSCTIGEVNTVAMQNFLFGPSYDIDTDELTNIGINTLKRFGYSAEDIKKKEGVSSLNALSKDAQLLEDKLLLAYPSGSTNYIAAMEQAQDYLYADGVRDNGHRKVIVLISDGVPNDIETSLAKADALKAQGIEFYTIGANVNEEARNTLISIATNATGTIHYCDSSTETLHDVIASLSKDIKQAGTNAVITDRINSQAFSYYTDTKHQPAVNGMQVSATEVRYDAEKKSVAWKVGDISENKKVLTYYVKLNEGLKNTDQLYETSKGVQLKYQDSRLDEQTKDLRIPTIKTKTGVLEKKHYLVNAQGQYIDRNGAVTTKDAALLKTEVMVNQPIGDHMMVDTEEMFEFEGNTYHGVSNPQEVIIAWDEEQIAKAEVEFTCTKPLQASFMVDDTRYDTSNSTLGSPFAKVSDPKKEGFQFAGWFSEENGQGSRYDATAIATRDVTYYAYFTVNTYNYGVQYYYDNALLDEVNGLQATYGSTITTYEMRDGDGKYTLVNVPQVIIGSDSTKNIMKVMYETKKFSVTFIDRDGTILANQNIDYGKDATAPSAPELDGYIFQGWDKAFKNITSDLIVQAVYEAVPQANMYLVTFVGMNGEVLSTQQVQQGEDASSPTSPMVEGYDFTTWDKDFTNVQGNLIVNAQYQIKSYEVIFTDRDGNEITRDIVDYGFDTSAPTAPAVDGYTFTGWDQEFTNIKENKMIQAQYSVVAIPAIIPATTTPSAPSPQPIVDDTQMITLPELAPQEVVPVQVTPKSDGEKEVVKKNATPKAVAQGYWALFNLLFAAATLVFAIFLLFNKWNKEEEDENDEDQSIPYQRKKWLRMVTSVVAIASVVLFVITEDITLTMRYADSWTLLMGIIFIVQILFFFYARKWKEIKEKQEV